MTIEKKISKAERTRQFIIEKSAPIFNKKGYDGTSLSDLIEATGLTKGAIYGNFENKDDVAVEAFEYNLSLIHDVINLRHTSGESSIQWLLKIPQFYRNTHRKIAVQGGCPILNAAVDADDNNSLLHKKVFQSINSWRHNIEQIIREGQTRKEIKKEINGADYATIFIALIEGGIMLAKALREPSHLMIVLDKVENMIKTELPK